MPFDIILVDDHKLVRDGVKTILERGAEFRIVGEADNGPDAVVLCKKTASGPGPDGYRAARHERDRGHHRTAARTAPPSRW